MRIYLPSTLPALREAVRAGHIGPATAHAVTPALREWYADGDLEELEYAAMAEAARASLRLLGADPDASRRRVVLAVEVADDAVARPAGDTASRRGSIELVATIPFTKVVSAHVDDPDALEDVAAAVVALPAADEGDEDAQFTVGGAEGHELMWYAAQEIPDLVSGFTTR